MREYSGHRIYLGAAVPELPTMATALNFEHSICPAKAENAPAPAARLATVNDWHDDDTTFGARIANAETDFFTRFTDMIG